MSSWASRLCAFLLALALMPGAVEILENVAHLAMEGHLAHAAAGDDHHEPSGPEHGCTPVSHYCGCHASLAFLAEPPAPGLALRAAGFSRHFEAEMPAAGFQPPIDHPPQS